jgi:hypothetical protein
MERRERRSPDRETALQLFIASQRRKLDVEALTVTTLDGKTIAGSGEIDQGRRGHWVATWQLRVGGEWLVLSSWGGRLTYEVGTGLRRILERTPAYQT